MPRLPTIAIARLLSASTLLGQTEAPAEPAGAFSETVEVREIVVRFDDSVLPRIESIGKRGDSDFVVTSNGAELAQLTAARGNEPDSPALECTLWFDGAFAQPRELARTARALASSPVAFAGGGEVELVVARPPLRRRFARGDAAALSGTLDGLARRWESEPAEAPSATARERALDRLALDRFERSIAAGVLVIAVGSVPATFEELDLLARLESETPSSGTDLPPIEQAARLVAASGWTTFAFAARALVDPRTEQRSAQRAESREVRAKNEPRFPMLQLLWKRATPPARTSVALDTALDLSLATWKPLARAGSGALVGEPGALFERMVRVAERRRLIVRPPEAPPGTLQHIEVRWAGGDGRLLPSARWRATGSPPGLASARLRSIAVGDLEASGAHAAGVELNRDEPRQARVCLPGEAQRRWLRLSALPIADPRARPEIGPPIELGADEAPCATLCRDDSYPSSCQQVGHPGDLYLIEDLESGIWAAATLPEW